MNSRVAINALRYQLQHPLTSHDDSELYPPNFQKSTQTQLVRTFRRSNGLRVEHLILMVSPFDRSNANAAGNCPCRLTRYHQPLRSLWALAKHTKVCYSCPIASLRDEGNMSVLHNVCGCPGARGEATKQGRTRQQQPALVLHCCRSDNSRLLCVDAESNVDEALDSLISTAKKINLAYSPITRG
jgi:hypothetical protein